MATIFIILASRMSNDGLKPAPIFLMCPERSGTNLISLLTSEHAGRAFGTTRRKFGLV